MSLIPEDDGINGHDIYLAQLKRHCILFIQDYTLHWLSIGATRVNIVCLYVKGPCKSCIKMTYDVTIYDTLSSCSKSFEFRELIWLPWTLFWCDLFHNKQQTLLYTGFWLDIHRGNIPDISALWAIHYSVLWAWPHFGSVMLAVYVAVRSVLLVPYCLFLSTDLNFEYWMSDLTIPLHFIIQRTNNSWRSQFASQLIAWHRLVLLTITGSLCSC